MNKHRLAFLELLSEQKSEIAKGLGMKMGRGMGIEMEMEIGNK